MRSLVTFEETGSIQRSYRLGINRNHGYVTVSNVGCCGYICRISETLFSQSPANYATPFFLLESWFCNLFNCRKWNVASCSWNYTLLWISFCSFDRVFLRCMQKQSRNFDRNRVVIGIWLKFLILNFSVSFLLFNLFLKLLKKRKIPS